MLNERGGYYNLKIAGLICNFPLLFLFCKQLLFRFMVSLYWRDSWTNVFRHTQKVSCGTFSGNIS